MVVFKKIILVIGICVLSVLSFVAGFSIHFLQEPPVASVISVEEVSDGVELKPVSILAFGDMMLDRTIRKTINKHGAGYPFENLKEFLKGYDIVVANAEGIFSEFPSKTLVPKAPLRFTFATSSLPILKETGFTLFSQANNHTYDFGKVALDQSRYFMKRAGIAYFGDPRNATGTSYTTTIRDKKITFIGYHQFSRGLDEILREITEAKTAGSFVIVYPHWGEEYNQGITLTQLEIGHSFVDAGADVVIGAHPHVIEPIEIYKDKVIFYSLGNFIFDQSFSRATMEGLAVSLSITNDAVTYKIQPFAIKGGQALLITDMRRMEILANLGKMSIVSTDKAGDIVRGEFTVERY